MKNSSDTHNLSRVALAVIFSFWFLVVGTCPAFAAAVSVDALWSGLFDNSGQPLAGGFVYTYAAGTTTPKATYVDSAKSSSLTNPIQLDAYGRAQVWADGAYKFVIKDADDVTLATIDNLEYVSSQNPSTLAVTSLSATGATLGSLTANVGVLTNMTISSATITLANLISPNVANASFTGVLYSPTINNATVTSPNITGGTLNSSTLATATISNPSLTGGTIVNAAISSSTITNVTLTGGTLSPATFTMPTSSAIATPTTDTQAANKGYVDAQIASYTGEGSGAGFSTMENNYYLLGTSTVATALVTEGSADPTNVSGFSLTNSTGATQSVMINGSFYVSITASETYSPAFFAYFRDDTNRVFDIFRVTVPQNLTDASGFPAKWEEQVNIHAMLRMGPGETRTFYLDQGVCSEDVTYKAFVAAGGNFSQCFKVAR